MPSPRNPVCITINCNRPYDIVRVREEYADAAAHQEVEQLRQLISQQAEAMSDLNLSPSST